MESEFTLQASSLESAELGLDPQVALETNYSYTVSLFSLPEFQSLVHDLHLSLSGADNPVLEICPLWLTAPFSKTAHISLYCLRSPNFFTNCWGLKPLQLPDPDVYPQSYYFGWRKLHLMHFCLFPPLTLTVLNLEGCPLNEFSLCSLGMLISIPSHARGII